MKNILDIRNDFEIFGSRKGRTEFLDNADIKGKSLLDLGCGYGWFLKYCLDNYAKQVSGIEISETDLLTAKESLNSKNVELKIGDSSQIPYPDNSFDTVTAWEVIEHIPLNAEKEMMKEVARVLKPNGVFYLSTPFDSTKAKIFDPGWWLIGHRHYNLLKLTEYGKPAGLIVKKSETKGGGYSMFFSINMYIAKWIFHRKPFFEQFFRYHSTNEYSQDHGYLTILVKYVKNNYAN